MKATQRFVALAALAMLAAPAAANDNAGWHARVDALLLNPTVSGQGFRRIFQEIPDGVYFDGKLQDGLEGGWRLVLAKENCCGFGVRFRYFDFENDPGTPNYRGNWENGVDLEFDGIINIDVHSVDIEATQRAQFRHWDLVFSGGLRQGSVEITQPGNLFAAVTTFYNIQSGVEFDGVGPTMALAAERPIGCTNFTLIGRARTAILFGELDQIRTFGPGAAPTGPNNTDEFVQYTELQFGLNYGRCIGRTNASFGVFWEAHRWDSDSGALGDLALHGLSLQTGLTF
jgi:hypothetical protein